MTAKTRTAPKAVPAAKSAPAKASSTAKVQSTDASFDWDNLADAEIVTYTTPKTPTVDVAAITPDPIKARVDAAYAATIADEKKTPQYYNQTCVTGPRAEEFLKLATRYAKYKGWTLRGRVIDDASLNNLIQRKLVPANTRTGSVVNFSVKEQETKVRLKDDQKTAIAKSLAHSPNATMVDEMARVYSTSKQTIRAIAKANNITLPDARKRNA